MRGLAVVFVSSFAFCATARADIPPGPFYVEQCTVARQQESSEVCVECSAWHGEPTRCRDTMSAGGHTQRCRSWGASRWTEVWCRARTEADGPAPSSCAAVPGARTNALFAILVSLALLAVSRRPSR